MPRQTRKNHLERLRRAGLDEAGYQAILSEQGKGCGICGKETTGRYNHIDHCHRTGKVRGILCNNCNLGIGYFDDNPTLLLKAIRYLKGKRK